MKKGWQYVQTNGTNEKMAPMTLVENVLMSEDGASLKEVMPSNPNLLINGDFQVWQRGLAFSGLSSGQYFADRWKMSCNGTVYADSRLINGRNAVLFDIGTDKTWCGISQSIEDKVNYHSGRTVCVTIYSPNPETILSALIETSGGNNWMENIVRSSDRITGTITIGQFSNKLFTLWIYFDLSKQFPSVYAVKMEEGSIATPLTPRKYAEELAICKRYYEKLGPIHILAPANLGFDQVFPFTVEKRIVPACRPYSMNGAWNKISFWNNSGWSDYDMSQLADVTTYGCRVGAALTTDKHFRFDLIADAEI